VTAATGLKRLAITIAAVVAGAVVTLVALSFLIPAASVRDAVAEEIHAVTGLVPMMRGDMSVSLFPSGTVTFRKVVLGDDPNGAPGVIADELTAHLRYFPLLAGRIEIADVTLVRPTITVTFLPGGQSNWSGLIQSLARALQPDPGRRASFSEIGIQDGDGMLLCTDGLTEMVPDPKIAAIMGGEETAENACRRLVDEALKAGGKDNVTVIVARYALPQEKPDKTK